MVTIDRSLDVVDTGIAVVFKVLEDTAVVLVSDVATVVPRVDERLVIEDRGFEETEVEELLTVTIVGRLDGEKTDRELVIDTMLLLLRPTVDREDETSVMGILMFALTVIIPEGALRLGENTEIE